VVAVSVVPSIIANSLWEIEFSGDGAAGPLRVVDRRTNRTIADAPYCYSIEVETHGFRHKATQFGECRLESKSNGQGDSLTLVGTFDFGKDGPTDIGIRHRLSLPTDAP